VSTARVYVGEVNPVCAPPVTGLVRVKDIRTTYLKEKEVNYETVPIDAALIRQTNSGMA
jgi:hypothetical protein